MTIPQRQKEYGRGKKKERQFQGNSVIVQEGKFESAMRQFKRKVEESGILQEIRERQEYIKPSIERKLAKGRAKARWRKQVRSQQLPKKLFLVRVF